MIVSGLPELAYSAFRFFARLCLGVRFWIFGFASLKVRLFVSDDVSFVVLTWSKMSGNSKLSIFIIVVSSKLSGLAAYSLGAVEWELTSCT